MILHRGPVRRRAHPPRGCASHPFPNHSLLGGRYPLDWADVRWTQYRAIVAVARCVWCVSESASPALKGVFSAGCGGRARTNAPRVARWASPPGEAACGSLPIASMIAAAAVPPISLVVMFSMTGKVLLALTSSVGGPWDRALMPPEPVSARKPVVKDRGFRTGPTTLRPTFFRTPARHRISPKSEPRTPMKERNVRTTLGADFGPFWKTPYIDFLRKFSGLRWPKHRCQLRPAPRRARSGRILSEPAGPLDVRTLQKMLLLSCLLHGARQFAQIHSMSNGVSEINKLGRDCKGIRNVRHRQDGFGIRVTVTTHNRTTIGYLIRRKIVVQWVQRRASQAQMYLKTSRWERLYH